MKGLSGRLPILAFFSGQQGNGEGPVRKTRVGGEEETGRDRGVMRVGGVWRRRPVHWQYSVNILCASVCKKTETLRD